MTGKFLNMDDGTDTDVQALEDGFASVVPVKIDFTDYAMKEALEKDWNL